MNRSQRFNTKVMSSRELKRVNSHCCYATNNASTPRRTNHAASYVVSVASDGKTIVIRQVSVGALLPAAMQSSLTLKATQPRIFSA